MGYLLIFGVIVATIYGAVNWIESGALARSEAVRQAVAAKAERKIHKATRKELDAQRAQGERDSKAVAAALAKADGWKRQVEKLAGQSKGGMTCDLRCDVPALPPS